MKAENIIICTLCLVLIVFVLCYCAVEIGLIERDKNPLEQRVKVLEEDLNALANVSLRLWDAHDRPKIVLGDVNDAIIAWDVEPNKPYEVTVCDPNYRIYEFDFSSDSKGENE